MNLDAINEDPDFCDTPFGRVSLVQPSARRTVFVVVEHPNTNEHAMLGVVDPATGRGVWDAFYGKRAHEAQHIYEKAERQRLAKEKSDAVRDELMRKDFRTALDKHMSRTVDGRDSLFAALRGRR